MQTLTAKQQEWLLALLKKETRFKGKRVFTILLLKQHRTTESQLSSRMLKYDKAWRGLPRIVIKMLPSQSRTINPISNRSLSETRWLRLWRLGTAPMKRGIPWWSKLALMEVMLRTKLNLTRSLKKKSMRKIFLTKPLLKVKTLLSTATLSSFYWLESTVPIAAKTQKLVWKLLTITSWS